MVGVKVVKKCAIQILIIIGSKDKFVSGVHAYANCIAVLVVILYCVAQFVSCNMKYYQLSSYDSINGTTFWGPFFKDVVLQYSIFYMID